MKNGPDISVVIVNYNVKDLILRCLETLFEFKPSNIELEVIVVDNNSKDGSVQAIKMTFPDITIISNNFNAGFPAANNQAFRISKGRYVFMLNPDTEFFDNALEKMFLFMENNQDVSMIGPKLLNSDLSLQHSFWRFPKLRYLFFDTLYLSKCVKSKYYADKNIDEPFEADSFSGAAILFKHELLDSIGLLDEKLFWIEEIDYCYRAVQAGFKLVYYPYSVIIHHVGQSAKKNYNISICNQVVNKIKFYKKYHSTFKWLMVILLSLGHVISKLIVFSILSPFKKMYFLKAKAYIYTFPRVFNPPTKMS